MAERTIGTDISPPDLHAKITGRARYAEDFHAEGMAFAKLLLSPMPHARVRSVDTSRAEAMEGVLGILRASELPRPEQGTREGALSDEPLYEGAPILAVAAVDETTAAAAVEAIRVDLEPLPFVLDPLDSLREGGPNARTDGNVPGEDGPTALKWPGSVFEDAGSDRLPMGEPTAEWAIGDVDAAFGEADVIVEETIVHQSVTHHPMEPRSCMAYWQNGKLFLHGSTQSTERTRGPVAAMAGIDVEDVVMIGEYCGGGFGSKIAGVPIMAVPAVLSRKIGRPVMLRITRYEENYIGRARAGFQGWAKIGFRSDGRMTALDLYLVQDSGAYGASDLFTAATVATASYQPENMRFRGVPVYTNTPPRSAQRAPGGAQIVAMLEPVVDKAARELGVDRLEIRKINAPGHDGWLGPNQGAFTSAYVREALDLGGELFDWDARSQLSGRREGTKVTGVGMGLSPGAAAATASLSSAPTASSTCTRGSATWAPTRSPTQRAPPPMSSIWTGTTWWSCGATPASTCPSARCRPEARPRTPTPAPTMRPERPWWGCFRSWPRASSADRRRTTGWPTAASFGRATAPQASASPRLRSARSRGAASSAAARSPRT